MGILIETRVKTGAGIYVTAVIYGLAATKIPTLIIPTLIIIVPALGMELWKAMHK